MKRVLFFALLFVSLIFWWINREDFRLTAVKKRQSELSQYANQHSVIAVIGFASLYAFLTTVSFPAAGVLSLLAGSIFGLWVGTALVLVSATLGSMGAFLLCRFLLGDWVRSQYGDRIAAIDRGFEMHGPYYLFWMRLSPVIPFFLINLGMGLTQISLWTFAWISLVGMAPGTWLYVNAGVRLAEIENASDLMSVPVVLSLIALGAVPLIFKWMLKHE